MSVAENKLIRRRLANAYLSSIISISLVLLLIGIASLLVVNTGSIISYFKENMQISVLLKQNVNEDDAQKYIAGIEKLPCVMNARLVTREEGTEDLVEMLGEDFLKVFESSPVPVSVEVNLHAEYVNADSLALAAAALSRSPFVDEVDCQQELVEALSSNLTRVSMVLGFFIALLLFVSFVLINNTVRLSVFSRRFTIHTMRMVGATRSFIRRPFLKNAVFHGLISSLFAILALGGIMFVLKRSFAQLFDIFRPGHMLVSFAVVLICGVCICVSSTFFVVNKLVSSSKDELYY